MSGEVFNEDYFLNGKKTGVSNYEDYRWLPELTIPMAEKLKEFLRFDGYNTILDFGCARGYLVKALEISGVNAEGYDSSKWAIENCDSEVKGKVYSELPDCIYDFIICKDVLEHLDITEAADAIKKMVVRVRQDILIIVPLTKQHNGDYFRMEDDADATHKIRWTFMDWLTFLQETTGLNVLGTTHIEGLKPASKEVPGSTGFFLIRK